MPYLRVRYWTVRTTHATKSSGVIKSVHIMQPHSRLITSSSSLLPINIYNDRLTALLPGLIFFKKNIQVSSLLRHLFGDMIPKIAHILILGAETLAIIFIQ